MSPEKNAEIDRLLARLRREKRIAEYKKAYHRVWFTPGISKAVRNVGLLAILTQAHDEGIEAKEIDALVHMTFR